MFAIAALIQSLSSEINALRVQPPNEMKTSSVGMFVSPVVHCEIGERLQLLVGCARDTDSEGSLVIDGPASVYN